MPSSPPTPEPDDPVHQAATAEARWIFCLWAIFGLWAVGFSYRYGYLEHARPAGDLAAFLPDCSAWDADPTVVTNTPLGLGIPFWAFWGVAVPWCLASIASIAFALFGIRNDPMLDHTAVDAHLNSEERDA